MPKVIPTYDICSIKQQTQATNDLLISRFAPYLKERHNLVKPHRHTFYHLVFFTEGAGKHTIDFETFDVKKGEMYFMAPGQVHSWGFKGVPDGYVVNFSENFFRSFLLDHRFLERFSFFGGTANEGVVFIKPQQQKEIISLFEQLLALNVSDNEYDTMLVKLLLLQLFAEVARQTEKKSEPKHNDSPVIRRFKELVNDKFVQLRLPKEYAALLHVSPNYLNGLCVKTTGISAGELIRNRVLLEAKRLLVNADLTIAQIAYRLNFTDPAHFSKFFKKATGEPAEEFRKKLL